MMKIQREREGRGNERNESSTVHNTRTRVLAQEANRQANAIN
jgi:hypothetical protein